jgi:hypothetical protein
VLLYTKSTQLQAGLDHLFTKKTGNEHLVVFPLIYIEKQAGGSAGAQSSPEIVHSSFSLHRHEFTRRPAFDTY